MPSTSPKKKSSRKSRSWAWRYRRLLFLGGLLAFTALAGALFVLTRVPLPRAGSLAQTTFLTDAGGGRLASIDAGENRVSVKLEQVPDLVVKAVLATEDKNFYEHGGIDPVGIVRATIADLRGRPLQGGSTITQQYVKNTYLGRERTIWRKIKEASMAVKVEHRFDKDEILERYLNTVYFGRGAYGVQAAARTWFGKDVTELGLNEGAYLAGLIRAPELADVDRNPEVARARRDRTLAAMARNGFITAKERDEAAAVALRQDDGGFVIDRRRQEPQIVAFEKGTQYFVEYVRRQLVEEYGTDLVYTGGLRVKTTLDLRLQTQAYDAVYGLLDRPDDPAGALVAVDGDGRIKAMVGGRDYAESKVNLAVGRDGGGSGRQAGSTFKPFTLATIVKEGFTVESAFSGAAKMVFPKADDGKDYSVSNFENEDFGSSVNLIDATRNSVNTVYVQAHLAIGAQKVVDFAKSAGITSELEPNASLPLGTEEVSPLEMASAFSTFANRGVHVRHRAVLEVRSANGRVLRPERDPERRRVMDREEADVVNFCLQQVVARGSGTGAKLPRPVAGKTGTTQDFGDAWFVGYTPKLTTAVWMGYPEGNVRKMTNVRGRKVNGGSFPATIFRRFMAPVVRDAQYAGDFPTVTKFPGKVLKGGARVEFSTSSTTSSTKPPPTTTTSTTAPAPGSTTTSAPSTASTTTSAPSQSTTTTTRPPPSSTTTSAPPA